jgi:GntR family transcriptional regulator
MPPPLRIDPGDPRPIWRQIEESVRHLVAAGTLPPGTAVPSVRDLARDLQINPATVAKAYQRLTDAGVLVVHRGQGTFVAEGPSPLAESERRRRLEAAALRYATLALSLGLDEDEAEETLTAAWRSLSAMPAGARKD